MSSAFWLFASLLLLERVGLISAHGRLLDPVCRSTMWRVGFKAPINYNDNGLNCGGYSTLWSINKGKCGVCGDPYNGRRDNEAGGKYATGQIVSKYEPGQLITAVVQLTVNHGGHFLFNLCPVNNPKVKATEDCFARYPLFLPNGQRMYVLQSRRGEYFHIPLRLPPGLTCRQCVFRWKYVTATAWGCDGSRCCTGCGTQEEFYGCSDVSIEPKHVTMPTRPPPTTRPPPPTTKKPTTPGLNIRTTPKVPPRATCQAKLPWRNNPNATPWCLKNCRGFRYWQYCGRYCEKPCFQSPAGPVAAVFSPRSEHLFWDGIIKASNKTIQTTTEKSRL